MSKLVESLNWADWFLIALIALSIGISVRRGMMREVVSLCTWILAFVFSYAFSDELAYVLQRWIQTPSVRLTVATLLLFAMTLVVGAMLSHVLADILQKTGLTHTDRLLGSLFGLARGVVIAIAFLLFVQGSFGQDPWWKQSRLITPLVHSGQWAQGTIDRIGQFTHSLMAKT